MFKLHSPYPMSGDQPRAVDLLEEGINSGVKASTLLGVTGCGKTFTMANLIARLNRPALVISHNKTLAAQLTAEFREFFPENLVEYFVSYYDYYQPEAYIPQSDTYIEKDSSINDEIDRLRHAATQAVMERRDVIVVASVSCIYGLGTPEEYRKAILVFRRGENHSREEILSRLVDMRFERNRMALTRGQFRLLGDTLEIYPADEEKVVRLKFFDETLEEIEIIDPLSHQVLQKPSRWVVYPAVHFVTSPERLTGALHNIELELSDRLQYFKTQGKLVEAQRLEQKTNYDLELIRELGFVKGIENYSRHLTYRQEGEPPYTLLDYFPPDFLVFIDESHVTLPQLRAMRVQDKARKKSLVDYGFRLPSAYDNRPLGFEEFLERVNQVVYVSATPGAFELEKSGVIAEQIIRPTGLIDPEVEIRPVENQVEDLIEEIKKRAEKKERSLVTTLTKKMSEALADYLTRAGVKVRYLHSEIDTLDRVEILRDLRLGEFDCLVGINLLREGLDLPEVSLVGILDADKVGFLRSATSLIQTMGRAARNLQGKVILYADRMTPAITQAVEETRRRREIQMAYNVEHNITPQSVQKAVKDILEGLREKEPAEYAKIKDKDKLSLPALQRLLKDFDIAMRAAAKNLEFEKAAALRDEMFSLKKEIMTRKDDTPLVFREEIPLIEKKVKGK